MTTYKDKLYKKYLSTQLYPDTITKYLQNRSHYIKNLINLCIPSNIDTKILDLACGYGVFLYYLKKLGYKNLKGIDISPEQVSAAKKIGLDCVVQGDILDTLKGAQDNSYDIIIAFDILEHLSKENLFIATEQIYRVLRKGGKMLIHVPNGDAIFPGAIYFSDLTHETCFTKSSMTQVLVCSGFKDIKFYEEQPIIHGIKSLVRFFLWNIFSALFRFIRICETGEYDFILSQNLLVVAAKEE